MKKLNRRLCIVNIILFLALVIFFTITLSAKGQGNPPIIPPGCDNPVPGIKNPNCPPDKVPLTGMEWLAVGGGVYAIKKLKERKRLISEQ